jgi:hypothetical protein
VASVWPICAMLQPSGPGNTPCLGWHLKILRPAFRRLEIPETIRSSSAATIFVAEPRARNRIFAARDKAAKSAVLPPQRPGGAYHTSHDARKCGLFSRSLREREVPRVRGGVRSPAKPVSNAEFPANRVDNRVFLKIRLLKRLSNRENPRAGATSASIPSIQ